MIIIIKAFSSVLSLWVQPDDTIASVKLRIQSMLDVPSSQQSLFYNKMQLADAVFLSAYGIKESSVLQLRASNAPKPLQTSSVGKSKKDSIPARPSDDLEWVGTEEVTGLNPTLTSLDMPLSPPTETPNRTPSTSPELSMNNDSSSGPTGTICRYYRLGRCDFGTRCRFVHDAHHSQADKTKTNTKTKTKNKGGQGPHDFDHISSSREDSYRGGKLQLVQSGSIMLSQPESQVASTDLPNLQKTTQRVQYVSRNDSTGIGHKRKQGTDEPKPGSLQFAARKLLGQKRASTPSSETTPPPPLPYPSSSSAADYHGAATAAGHWSHKKRAAGAASSSSEDEEDAHGRLGASGTKKAFMAPPTSSGILEALRLRPLPLLQGTLSVSPAGKNVHATSDIASSSTSGGGLSLQQALEELRELKVMWEHCGRRMDSLHAVISGHMMHMQSQQPGTHPGGLGDSEAQAAFDRVRRHPGGSTSGTKQSVAGVDGNVGQALFVLDYGKTTEDVITSTSAEHGSTMTSGPDELQGSGGQDEEQGDSDGSSQNSQQDSSSSDIGDDLDIFFS